MSVKEKVVEVIHEALLGCGATECFKGDDICKNCFNNQAEAILKLILDELPKEAEYKPDDTMEKRIGKLNFNNCLSQIKSILSGGK